MDKNIIENNITFGYENNITFQLDVYGCPYPTTILISVGWQRLKLKAWNKVGRAFQCLPLYRLHHKRMYRFFLVLAFSKPTKLSGWSVSLLLCFFNKGFPCFFPIIVYGGHDFFFCLRILSIGSLTSGVQWLWLVSHRLFDFSRWYSLFATCQLRSNTWHCLS